MENIHKPFEFHLKNRLFWFLFLHRIHKLWFYLQNLSLFLGCLRRHKNSFDYLLDGLFRLLIFRIHRNYIDICFRFRLLQLFFFRGLYIRIVLQLHLLVLLLLLYLVHRNNILLKDFLFLLLKQVFQLYRKCIQLLCLLHLWFLLRFLDYRIQSFLLFHLCILLLKQVLWRCILIL